MAGGIRGLARAGSIHEVCGLDREGLARRVLVAVQGRGGSFRGRSGASPHGRLYVPRWTGCGRWANVRDTHQQHYIFLGRGWCECLNLHLIWKGAAVPPGANIQRFRHSGVPGQTLFDESTTPCQTIMGGTERARMEVSSGLHLGEGGGDLVGRARRVASTLGGNKSV